MTYQTAQIFAVNAITVTEGFKNQFQRLLNSATEKREATEFLDASLARSVEEYNVALRNIKILNESTHANTIVLNLLAVQPVTEQTLNLISSLLEDAII